MGFEGYSLSLGLRPKSKSKSVVLVMKPSFTHEGQGATKGR